MTIIKNSYQNGTIFVFLKFYIFVNISIIHKRQHIHYAYLNNYAS